MTCHDESGERRNGSSAGHLGEQLTGPGGLTNMAPRAPECFKRMRKIVQLLEPLRRNNDWAGYSSFSV